MFLLLDWLLLSGLVHILIGWPRPRNRNYGWIMDYRQTRDILFSACHGTIIILACMQTMNFSRFQRDFSTYASRKNESAIKMKHLLLWWMDEGWLAVSMTTKKGCFWWREAYGDTTCACHALSDTIQTVTCRKRSASGTKTGGHFNFYISWMLKSLQI